MNHDDKTTSRADMLAKLAMAPIAIGALAALRAEAEAAATMDPKSPSVAYQTKPNAGKQCSTCSLFIAGKDAKSNGTCQVVKGPISPSGWCKLYSPKAK